MICPLLPRFIILSATSSDSKTATTDANGEYSITGITEASVTLTPTKSNYTFSPETLTLTMDQDLTGQDFVATLGTGISSKVSNATVVSTEYYSIIGQKLAKPQFEGLNIVVKKMSDGTVITEKKYIKR